MDSKYSFNGLGMGLGNLARLSNAKTRSISAENFTGAKGEGGKATEGTGSGAARELGQTWKVSPSIDVDAGTTFTLADITGPAAIQHIWITTSPDHWRDLILRAYWDSEETASIECPLGDFFANGWCEYAHVNSMPIAVNSVGGMNSYWEMPFRQHARVTLENIGTRRASVYFQITYTLTEIPEDMAYLHAQYRRSNPLSYKTDHVLLDTIVGKGHYVGTYLAWQSNNTGWWGEGEIKFFLDGDTDFPTICGTGTEDYFGGAWCFLVNREGYTPAYGSHFPQADANTNRYGTYSTAFLGLPQAIVPDGLYRSQTRFGLYRWHIMDPIRFDENLRVTIQALGWRSGGRYLPLQDDISSTSFWYQTEPHAPFPQLPDVNGLEVI